MSTAPADLLQFRADARAVTGLGAVDVGIVGDGAHQRTGGFHEGRDVLVSIGRYHPPASSNIGSSGEDYSARQARDRNGLTNSSSASDVGSQWPHGGRAAWLRFNNLLYAEMRDHPERLPALRAVNVSLDGRTKLRFDQLHRSDGLIASKDTVDTHTHMEFHRDTEGRRKATLDRIVQLMRAAVNGAPAPPVTTEDDDMANTWTQPLTQGTAGYAGQQRDTALAFTWQSANEANTNTKTLIELVKALAARQGIDATELDAIEDAAKAGAAEAFAEQQESFITALLARLPQGSSTFTVADLENAVRLVFADAGQP